jgi:2-dehydro-3-deoxyphosphogluconate aldolase/(4S)-4-hydroxy-2-oxoglutarate aldolase
VSASTQARALPQLPDLLHRGRVLPVTQLTRAADAVPLAEALAGAGLPAVEITFRTPAAADAIAAAARAGALIVGAGTVRTVAQADQAIAAGAQFVVSPGFSRPVAERCLAAGVPVIPGVATASEVMAAGELGLNVLKFFPAEAIGGVAALRALYGPFPDVRFVPTGGIGQQQLTGYLAVPSVLAVGGSWVAPSDLIEIGDWAAIGERARAAVATPRD